jgi:hypothetical protein
VIVGQGIALAGARLQGGLMLAGARIKPGINASNIKIESSGRALEADTMHVGGNWIMRGGDISGNIRFAGARIDGQIAFTECKIRGGGDLAIRADGANIGGGWFMGRAVIAGMVRFPSACVGNEMRLRGTRIVVSSGPALFAAGVTIAREFVLDGGFSTQGGIVLDRAEIDGTLDLTGSRIKSAALGRGGAAPQKTHDEMLSARYDAVALSLVDARLDRLVMPETAEDRSQGIIDLSRARVGSYEDAAAAWPPPGRRRALREHNDLDHLVLDGFVYDHLKTPTGLPPQAGRARRAGAARMRILWLEAQSRNDVQQHFKPQAWVHLSRRLAAQVSDCARCHECRRSAAALRSRGAPPAELAARRLRALPIQPPDRGLMTMCARCPWAYGGGRRRDANAIPARTRPSMRCPSKAITAGTTRAPKRNIPASRPWHIRSTSSSRSSILATRSIGVRARAIGCSPTCRFPEPSCTASNS